ncbi:thioredoxin family protein [Pseudorhodoferax sp.]|uniref:thioredoxin family protein n=1 Tax=Pseudorhodoferax sp. TaxID=1993553 RepID=UPI002DD628B0|nr:thioredoxin family protein [Pseudorhodoferax sp.]
MPATPAPPLAALTLVLALALNLPAPAAAAAPPSTQVAWLQASARAHIDQAFAQARQAGKPVLLYWGATWCPPCNQLKATLFNRQDFAALSRSFVAVHVDGDLPGAQKIGQQFKVSGYPTMVLMRPDGSELTRLPGEADAEQVMALLRLGLAGGRPVKAVLDDARAGKPLAADDWRLLSFYSWETDDDQLLAGTDAATVLAQLAPAATAANGPAEAVTRLWLKALAASDDGKGVKADDGLRERVRKVLADPAQVRLHADVIGGRADDIVRAVGASAQQRQAFAALFEPALRRLEADATLSRADRLSALVARVELARLELPRRELRPTLPAELLAHLREHVAEADRGIRDGYERQAVLPYAAYALERAGLWADSEALLRSNLARSHSPYYLMSQLGSLKRKLGQNAEALDWYAQAFDKSQGPATRLQWGAAYLQALVDLAPGDAARIEKTAGQLFDEAAQDDGAFYKRSGRSMQRVGRALQAWNKEGSRDASLRRLQARLGPLCSKVDESDGRRANCQALLAGAAGKPAGKPAG